MQTPAYQGLANVPFALAGRRGDMTPPMIDRARATAAREGFTNVEFRLGEIENLPVANATVDVIISNCVINLSPEKSRVFRRGIPRAAPGRPFSAVSDVVTRGEIDPQIRASVLAWVGCVAGALDEQVYRDKLAAAGFTGIDVEPTRVYRVEDARDFIAASGLDAAALAPMVDGKFMSGFVRARKPLG